ncbi:hypothetical protein C8D72_0527 [Kushneria indalinina DSM 14324]|uniref:Uncharacterized protein n=1 Tax=Kushneria indalinina DSM 14324 TaxID=1122140 RepID=A0A3D9DYJ2_9GAMM|nr:hypothetical protein C8D72_0527 [Kushneria indalinina DSM 14324]
MKRRWQWKATPFIWRTAKSVNAPTLTLNLALAAARVNRDEMTGLLLSSH